MAMPPFSVNPHRQDPYKQFKFRVLWDGRAVAGVSRISPLRRSTEVISYRDGAAPSLQRRLPGTTIYEPIMLERGRTHDAEFERWANKVWHLGANEGLEVSLADFRKDITIELHNEAGQTVMAFQVFRCWPSEYVALSELHANADYVAFESLKLEHEGWQRDQAVVEPQEPSFSEPP
jgi:phage tail-like protein